MLYPLNDCSARYKRKLRRVNKKRIKVEVNKEIDKILEDFEDSFYDDIQEQSLIDLDKYDIEEDEEWNKFIGNTWTLDDELEYCDKVFNNIDEELDEQLVEDVLIGIRLDDSADPINKACISLKACRSMQDLFIKHGVKGRHKLLFESE